MQPSMGRIDGDGVYLFIVHGNTQINSRFRLELSSEAE